MIECFQQLRLASQSLLKARNSCGLRSVDSKGGGSRSPRVPRIFTRFRKHKENQRFCTGDSGVGRRREDSAQGSEHDRKARTLLGLTSSYVKFDRQRAFELLVEAINVISKIDEPDLSYDRDLSSHRNESFHNSGGLRDSRVQSGHSVSRVRARRFCEEPVVGEPTAGQTNASCGAVCHLALPRDRKPEGSVGETAGFGRRLQELKFRKLM